jgi:hypothetical protein
MPSITLADIQAAADKKYGPLVVDLGNDKSVTMRNPLRLPKAKRAALAALDGDGADVDAKLAEIVKIACAPADAKALLSAVGDDLPALAEIVSEWTSSAQVGEASPSPR